jgi:hypothetical protein
MPSKFMCGSSRNSIFSAATPAVLTLLVALVLTVAVVTSPAWAQVVTGAITGTVADPSGAVVAGATVTLTNTGTGAVQTGTTSGTGNFRFSLLGVGHYDLEVNKTGFRKEKLAGIAVDANVERGLGTLKLELGPSTESVEVSAAPALIEATQAQVTTAISGEALQTYAGVGENEGADYIALTLPGVADSRDNNFSNTNGVGFSVNGIRGRNNDQQIDGQNNNDNSVAGPALFLGDTEFVSEYQATTDNFGPEYGRNSGSVINIVTKSGSNRWHGTIFGNETNSVLTSLTNLEKDYDTPPLTRPPRFNQEYSGGTVGGPLLKNKIFVFGGFTNTIDSSSAIFNTGLLVPTPTGIGTLASCFPGSTSVAALQTYGPYGIGGGSPTPSGTPSTAYYDNAPVNNTTDPTTGDPACGYQLNGIQRSLPNGFHTWDWIARLDAHVSDSDSFNIRYFFQKQNYINGAFGASVNASGYPVSVPSIGQSGLIDWTHTFSNRMLNELRVGFQRSNVEFGTNTLGTVPGQGAVGTALTNVGFTNSSLLGFGPATNMPQGRIVNSYQLQDNFSFTWKNHQLKWGANITNQRSPNVFLPNYNGAYLYSDWGAFAANGQFPNVCAPGTGPGSNPALACLADGASSVSVTQGNAEYGFKEWDTFFYVGDDWKVKSNLTLNLGLTYSYLGQPANIFHQETVAQQTGPTPYWSTSLPLSATTSPSIGKVYTLFGPSVGFAWSPGGRFTGGDKTVIRGGYRRTYDFAFYNIFLLNAISAPVVLAQTLEPTAPTTTTPGVPVAGLLGAPLGPAVRGEYASSLTEGVFDPRNFNRTVTPSTLRPDTYDEWSFGIQREITRNAVVEARYVGNRGRNEFQSVNVNPYIAGLAASYPNLVPSGDTPCPAASAVVPNAVGRINCNEGITDETGNTGYGNYNGLQTEFRATNLFKQLTLRTSYTWSKTLDNSSEIFSTFAGGNSVAYSQNVLNYTGQEYGLSGLNFPQTWTLTFIEDIPLMRSQHGLLGHILGGWAFSGTYLLQSGQGFTPSQEFANYFSGGVANDVNFDLANIGTYETSRPFVGSLSAPEQQVGIFAGDAAALYGVGGTLAPNTLLSLNAINIASANGGQTNPVAQVSQNQVRLIINGGEADSVFGTPFGNAGRNSLRDYHTDVGNFTLFKNFRFGERAILRWDMTMNNVFNHPNYGSVVPFAELAGTPGAYTTFADPQVTSTGQNSCPAGTRCIFFGLKVIY